MLASLVIGLAPNPATLLISRAVQGAGAAVLAPITLSLLTIHFAEGEERNRAFAQYAAAAGIGSSLGLVLGGIFAGWISWRVGFLVNVPVGLALFIAASRLLAQQAGTGGRLDMTGAVISTLGMAGLVYGIVRSATAGWADPVTLGAIAAGVMLIAIFLLSQARRTSPLLPLRLFRNRERVGAYLARMMFLGAMVSFFFFSTQLMQGELRMTPVQAGFGFLPMTVLTFLASLALPRLVRAFGNGVVLVAAFLAMAIGLVWLARAGVGGTYLSVVAAPMLLIGRGISAPDAALAHGITAGLHGSAVLAVLGLILSLTLITPSERHRT